MERSGPAAPIRGMNSAPPAPSRGLDCDLEAEDKTTTAWAMCPFPPPPGVGHDPAVATLAAFLERQGIQPETLDDLVLDVAYAMAHEGPEINDGSHVDASGIPDGRLRRLEGIASSVNNGGLHSQVEFLFQHAFPETSATEGRLATFINAKLGLSLPVRTPDHGYLLEGLKGPYPDHSFSARLLMPGDRYGRNGCLVWGEEKWRSAGDPAKALPGVEFYDERYKGREGMGSIGQFVSRYNLSTLLGHPENRGLALDGGIPEWSINAEDIVKVNAWARVICPDVKPDTRW